MHETMHNPINAVNIYLRFIDIKLLFLFGDAFVFEINGDLKPAISSN